MDQQGCFQSLFGIAMIGLIAVIAVLVLLA